MSEPPARADPVVVAGRGTARLGVGEVTTLCARALERVGYDSAQAEIIADNLVDAELCGYPSLGLARLLTIVEDPRVHEPRSAVRVVRETPVSALVDGGNCVGLYAAHRAAEIAIAKAQRSDLALVGLYNSFLSGRIARYLELIGRAGFVGIHLNSSKPFVVAPNGRKPVLGTNPIGFGIPGTPDPLVFDMATSAVAHADIVLAARRGEPLPPGVAVDRYGEPTRDAQAALEGGIEPLAGHKGFGLSLMVQILGLIAGAGIPDASARGWGFLFIVFRPDLLVPAEVVERDVAALLDSVRKSPTRPGVTHVRLPSERAFAARARHRAEGLSVAPELLGRLHELA